ncbi:MAG: hypothetical protein MRZ79_21475 [Bacteroidia bacterium]|nr:hypothetical protein [Bacteroidia bacterium]
MKKLILIISTMVFCLTSAHAVVMYDEGRETIDGIQLLRDREDPLAYYYLPQYPHLSKKEDGSLEFLCMKYVGKGGEETNGGIFHALIEFSLPVEVIATLQAKLEEKINGARIVGPVPMMQAAEDDEDGLARFSVVSAILNDTKGDNPFTSNVLTSGFAPLLPGSKAAIAAKLNQSGATLLWESLSGPTSDISVSVRGYYEAAVKGYNAVITADMSTVYKHYSKIKNQQSGYTKKQLRDINDSLIQTQMIKIDVFDRSKGLGIKVDDMENILNMVTDKLIELMFDAENGWAKTPEREAAVEANQLKGRQERGWFAKTFLGPDNTPYYSDNQYVLKKREDVRVNKFYLNLSKSTTIKVPIYSSGNIGGLYDKMKEDPRYFRIVDMDDAAFQKRDVHFQVDGTYINAFEELINFATITFVKDKEGGEAITRDLVFRKEGIDKKYFQTVSYPRLGSAEADWLNYKYKVSWSIKGIPEAIVLPSENTWERTNATSIPLVPPLEKRSLEVDADRGLFKESNVLSCTIRLMTILGGKARVHKTLVLRANDTEGTSKTSLFFDPGEPILYEVSWYSRNGRVKRKAEVLDGEYLFLIPPSEDEFTKN